MNIYKDNFFDVIIIGGGHSGTEASFISSVIGCKTLLITNNIDSIGQMSCNPSIGGIGKSHLVKEIDSLGGIMGISIDRSGIQFRKLNTNKGKAVQSTRSQADRILYCKEIKNFLFKENNLLILQQKLTKLIIKNNSIKGIVTNLGLKYFSNSVVLALGTFLNSKIYIGINYSCKGGRINDISSDYLSDQLKDIFPLSINKLKTGTPPRIDYRQINYTNLKKQESDYPLPMFSFIKQKNFLKKLPCYITHTNKNTHDIILNNLNKSPIYNKIIKGKGPRYCPSIEDKILNFKDKESHQIFLEPEGLYTNEIYPNGISMSLPIYIQKKVINSIKGLEKCNIIRPGYAVEYDFLDPKKLKHTLESKIISGLFISGQLNGTTGYEEAAAQGIISGINASMFSKNKKQWFPNKDYSYIGVMINDLCKNGVIEPYRIFTCRSENRLSLREDNSDLRLTEYGRKLGTISDYRWKIFNNKKKNITIEKIRFKKIIINNNIDEIKNLNKNLKNPILKNISGYEFLKHKEISYKDILKMKIFKPIIKTKNIYETIETDIKYENYISKQNNEINCLKKYKKLFIPKNINYNKILGLSNESKYILNKYKPKTIELSLKISGITPVSVLRIIMWIKKNNILKKK